MTAIAVFFANLLLGYAFIGIFFAIYFVSAGAQRLDPGVKSSPLGFRLLILPGSAALWPVLLGRLIRGHKHPPEERNRHRDLAQNS